MLRAGCLTMPLRLNMRTALGRVIPVIAPMTSHFPPDASSGQMAASDVLFSPSTMFVSVKRIQVSARTAFVSVAEHPGWIIWSGFLYRLDMMQTGFSIAVISICALALKRRMKRYCLLLPSIHALFRKCRLR